MIITVTQCHHGSVSGIYETGKALLDIGIVPGSDITPEAALTKLSYVLSKTELSREEKMKLVETNIVGEMTVIKINSTGTENKLRYYLIYRSKIGRSFGLTKIILRNLSRTGFPISEFNIFLECYLCNICRMPPSGTGKYFKFGIPFVIWELFKVYSKIIQRSFQDYSKITQRLFKDYIFQACSKF